MQRLFPVGARLLGIYYLSNAVIEAAMLATGGHAAGASRNEVQLAIYCLIHFAAGCALTFFTGFIATAIRLREVPDEAPAIALFMVAAKLLGINFIVLALFNATWLNSGLLGQGNNWQLGVPIVLQLVLGTFLIFFTDIAAVRIGVREPTNEPPTLSSRSALEVGIVLIGISQFMWATRDLVRRIVSYWEMFARTRSFGDLLGPEIAPVLIALCLIFLARKIALFLDRLLGQPADSP